MAYVLPDNILETLICDLCHKYLSVKPITVYSNRKTKCGRCSRIKKQSDSINSLYGNLAEHCLFKCVNRYDGCKKLLSYSQVREHEKVCLSKSYKCPLCDNDNELQTFLLRKHFRDIHKDNILDSPNIFLRLNQSLQISYTYLYQLEDHLFFINISINQTEESIKMNVSYLGDSIIAETITQQFIVLSENDDFIYESRVKQCTVYGFDNSTFCSELPSNVKILFIKFNLVFKNPQLEPSFVDNNPHCSNEPNITSFTPLVKNESYRKLYLSSNFQLRFPKILLSKCNFAIVISDVKYYLQCFNCKEICWKGLSGDNLVQNFYFSMKLNHSICYYCFQMLKNDKKVYENEYMVTNLHKDMIKNIEFFCKWNCQRTFSAENHLGHEETCKNQPLQFCPEENCNYRGTISEISEHMNCHSNKKIYALSNFYISFLFDRNIYAFIQNKFVFVKVLNKEGLNLSINLCSSSNKDKKLPIMLLFNENKLFLTSFTRNVTVKEANYWVKIIIPE